MPDHYKLGAIRVEPIVVCSRMSFCLGNFVKYVCRAPHKGNELEDLKKALWYIEHIKTDALYEELEQVFTNNPILGEILFFGPDILSHLLLDHTRYDVQELIKDELKERIEVLSKQTEDEQRN